MLRFCFSGQIATYTFFDTLRRGIGGNSQVTILPLHSVVGIFIVRIMFEGRKRVFLRWAGATVCAIGTATTVWVIILALYDVAWPVLCMTASFLLAHWVWTGAGFVVLVVLCGAGADAARYRAEPKDWRCDHVLHEGPLPWCGGSTYTNPLTTSDCARPDPFDNCARLAPCIGVSFGDSFVDPCPKFPPCPDVVGHDHRIVHALQSHACVEFDPCLNCFRPTSC